MPNDPDGPDFCSASGVLFLLLVSVALALLLAVARADGPDFFWLIFGFQLLAVSWLLLLGAAMTCLVWRRLNASSTSRLVVSFLLIELLVVSASLAHSREMTFGVPAGTLQASSPGWFVFRNAVIAAIVFFVFARFISLTARWRQAIESAANARLHSLQSRVRPHFLFNTLNTISSLIHDHPDQAEQATLDMADLLRTGLKDESTHALSDELDLVRGYLRIEQLRLGERLKVEWDIADTVPFDQQLPPLLLQPLVENAVIHGIARRAEGGTLKIEARKIRFARLRFTVTNRLADPDSRPAEGNQSALENIRQRLALAYEERYGLKTWTADGYFIAELTIPVT